VTWIHLVIFNVSWLAFAQRMLLVAAIAVLLPVASVLAEVLAALAAQKPCGLFHVLARLPRTLRNAIGHGTFMTCRAQSFSTAAKYPRPSVGDFVDVEFQRCLGWL